MKNRIAILICIILSGLIFSLPQKAQAYEYAAPAWMDNEHIICVKYIPTTKKRLIPWLGDLSDARYILTKQEIQIVSMDINGNNEKVIKSIIIDYPGMSPKWQEEVFQGMNRIDQIAYCPQRKLIVFSTHGFTERVYMINADGTGARRIAEVGGGMYFSPDGKYMEYTSKYKVWLYDLDTGEQNVLIEDAVSGPWSPDGKKIAIVRDLNKENNIYIYDLETGKEEKVDVYFSFGHAWPEGCRVDYERILERKEIKIGEKSTYKYETIISDITQEGIKERVNLGEMQSTIWSDNRNTIIYVKDDYFWSFNIETGINKKLFKRSYMEDKHFEYLYPMKSLDNEQILVSTTHGRLSIYDLNSGKEIARSKERFSFLLYSPDKTKILVNTDQGFGVVEIYTLRYKQLLKERVYAY